MITREQALKMAKDALIQINCSDQGMSDSGCYECGCQSLDAIEELSNAAFQLGAQAEREACLECTEVNECAGPTIKGVARIIRNRMLARSETTAVIESNAMPKTFQDADEDSIVGMVGSIKSLADKVTI